jgi:hypothetical protein
MTAISAVQQKHERHIAQSPGLLGHEQSDIAAPAQGGAFGRQKTQPLETRAAIGKLEPVRHSRPRVKLLRRDSNISNGGETAGGKKPE